MNRFEFNKIWILIGVLLISISNFAQESEKDSLKNKVSTEKSSEISSVKLHSPKKAAIMSAIIPGLGQIYNKKYWKLPIIYGAYGYTTYALIKNHQDYTLYRDAYKQRVDDIEGNESLLPEFDTENLRISKNFYWKNRDLNFLILIGLHALNILDAAVDAHLFYFDISDDLTLNIKPDSKTISHSSGGYTSGLTFAIKF